MNDFKKEFKNILKKPLYWLVICVILLVYTTEVIPMIKLYGPDGRDMEFYTASQKITLNMARSNVECMYKYGDTIIDKRFLGIHIGYEKAVINKNDKKELKKMLDEFDSGNMNYRKYKVEIDKIYNRIQRPAALGFSYSYIYLAGEDSLKNYENYMEFRKEVNEIMKSMSFSKGTATFFADIMGTIIAIFPIFFIAFIYKRKKVNLISYYVAMTVNVFLFTCILGVVTYFLSSKIGNLYNWRVSILDFIQPLFVWLLPTILYTIAEMILLSILIKKVYIIVFVQYLYAYMTISFDIKLSSFVIRWNNYLYLGYEKDLNKYSNIIYQNRVLYIIITILIILLIKKLQESKSFKCKL